MLRLMLKTILLVCLTFCAGSWAYVFAPILAQGGVTFNEPDTGILIVELSIACLLTVCGILLIITTIRRDRC